MVNSRRKIILVDDNEANLAIGRNMLRMFYEVYPAPSAAKLFDLMENFIPDLILLDIEMPEMDGYEAMKVIKANPRYKDIPVIFVTSLDDARNEMEGFDLGAVDYVTKPYSGPLLLKRIANQLLIVQQRSDLLASQLELQRHAENLEAKVVEKTSEVFELQNTVLATLADLVEFRDKHTGGHITRTQMYLKLLVEEMNEQDVYRDEIMRWDPNFFLMSSQLHDVGKIAISDTILNKPAKLTPEEFEIMKTHVTVGIDVIERVMSEAHRHSFLSHSLLIAGTHHEKWDGSGYPLGLKGSNIPIEGRLMAIADVYDALISVRPYKKPFTHEEARDMIKDGAGSHFDPSLVDIFMSVENKFADIAASVE